MEATIYRTELLPDYSRIFSDISAHLARVPSFTKDIPNVNAGAFEMSLTFERYVGGTLPNTGEDVTVFNYAVIGGFKYFITNWRQVTTNAATCDLTFDHIHNYGSILVHGRIIAAHDMPDLIRQEGTNHARKYGQINYPVNPVCGNYIRSQNFANGVWNSLICAVAQVTIEVDNETRNVLIYSNRCNIETERSVLLSYTGIMGRAKVLKYGSDEHEIMHVNKIWLIPAFLISDTWPTPNASVQISSTQTLPVYWAQTRFVANFRMGEAGLSRFYTSNNEPYPVFLKVGNFATNLTLPLTTLYCDARVNFLFDSESATMSMVLINGDKRVDMLPSLTMNFAARRQDETEASRNLTNTLSLLGSILSLAGGVATGQPLPISAGIIGVAGTVGKMATEIVATESSVEGQAMLNVIGWSQENANNVYGTTLNGFGILVYAVENEGELRAEMARTGYRGDIVVRNANLFEKTTANFDYNVCFRQYANDAEFYVVNEGLRDESRVVIRDVLTRGTTVYYGNSVEFPNINWDASNAWED